MKSKQFCIACGFLQTSHYYSFVSKAYRNVAIQLIKYTMCSMIINYVSAF